MKVYEIIKQNSNLNEGKFDFLKKIKTAVGKLPEKFSWLKWKKTPPELRKAPARYQVFTKNKLGYPDGGTITKLENGEWAYRKPGSFVGDERPIRIQDKASIQELEARALKQIQEEEAAADAAKGVVQKTGDAVKNNPVKTATGLGTAGVVTAATWASRAKTVSTGLKWLLRSQQLEAYAHVWQGYYDNMDSLAKQNLDDETFAKNSATILANSIVKTLELASVDGFPLLGGIFKWLRPTQLAGGAFDPAVRLFYKRLLTEEPDAPKWMVAFLIKTLGLGETLTGLTGTMQALKLPANIIITIAEKLGLATEWAGKIVDRYYQEFTGSSSTATPNTNTASQPGGSPQAEPTANPPAPAAPAASGNEPYIDPNSGEKWTPEDEAEYRRRYPNG